MQALVLASQSVQNAKVVFLRQIIGANEVGLGEAPEHRKAGGSVHDATVGNPGQSLPYRNHLQDRDKKDVYLVHSVFVEKRRGRVDEGESGVTEERHALQDDFSHVKIYHLGSAVRVK